MSERYPRSSEMTRERILNAARDQFSQRGIEAVSVRDVAKDASVSHALVHSYFGSKTDLVEAVLARDLTGFGEALTAHEGEDPLRTVVRHALDNKPQLMLFLRAQIDGYRPHRFIAPESRAMGILTERLSDSLPTHDLAMHSADPRAVLVALGAAGLGMAAAMEPLMAAAGLENVDPKVLEDHIIDFMTQMVAECFTGAERASA